MATSKLRTLQFASKKTFHSINSDISENYFSLLFVLGRGVDGIAIYELCDDDLVEKYRHTGYFQSTLSFKLLSKTLVNLNHKYCYSSAKFTLLEQNNYKK